MIARLLISPVLETRVGEIEKTLALYIKGVTHNHPDIFYFSSGEKLGIEQARKIKEHFSLKPYSAKGRAVVLEDASALTTEAQNALLKILEEPPEEALILLGAKSESDLLPTVLSRCQIVHLDTDLRGGEPTTYGVGIKDIDKLLEASIEERFEYIEKLKDREELLHAMVSYFRNQLLQMSHDRGTFDKAKLHNFLKELLQAERWTAQNVNTRAILEYLMMVMPSQK